MPTLNVLDHTGKKKSTLKVDDTLLNADVNPALMAQAVRVFQSNQRQGSKHVKTRSQVNYSTAKIWRQKGTGRARHGSRRAPIFVGGSQAHGPTGEENYRLKLTKKMRRQVLAGALTQKHQEKSLIVVDSFKDFKGKTKNARALLEKIASYPDKKVLIIIEGEDRGLLQAVKNLPKVSVTRAYRAHIFELLLHPIVVVTPDSLKVLSQRLSPKKDN